MSRKATHRCACIHIAMWCWRARDVALATGGEALKSIKAWRLEALNSGQGGTALSFWTSQPKDELETSLEKLIRGSLLHF